jgi:hypothetical protein
MRVGGGNGSPERGYCGLVALAIVLVPVVGYLWRW